MRTANRRSSPFGINRGTAAGIVVLSVTVLVLITAACVAALIPARRAAGVEPMRALRSE